MPQFLVFTLAAPFASFGTLAVGERRPTWDRPSKSQVLGLVASALGIERREEERQRALARSFGFAVRVDDPGQLLTDYHTTQQPSGPSVRRRQRQGLPVQTRRDELLCDDIENGLSRRELRESSHYTIALWERAAPIATLSNVADDLTMPTFVLFAGRKANTVQFPCGPQLVSADDVAAAFALFDGADADRKRFREHWTPGWLNKQRSERLRAIYTDSDGISGHAIVHIEERRDLPESRAKWRFLRREEALLRPLQHKAPTS